MFWRTPTTPSLVSSLEALSAHWLLLLVPRLSGPLVGLAEGVRRLCEAVRESLALVALSLVAEE